MTSRKRTRGSVLDANAEELRGEVTRYIDTAIACDDTVTLWAEIHFPHDRSGVSPWYDVKMSHLTMMKWLWAIHFTG